MNQCKAGRSVDRHDGTYDRPKFSCLLPPCAASLECKALIEKLCDHPMSTGTSYQVTYLCSGYKENFALTGPRSDMLYRQLHHASCLQKWENPAAARDGLQEAKG